MLLGYIRDLLVTVFTMFFLTFVDVYVKVTQVTYAKFRGVVCVLRNSVKVWKSSLYQFASR